LVGPIFVTAPFNDGIGSLEEAKSGGLYIDEAIEKIKGSDAFKNAIKEG
jgi:hypothetical protein